MSIKRLSNDFIDYQVVHATGVKSDIVQCIHDFCLENLPNFGRDIESGDIYETMLFILSGEEINNEHIAYFTHEVLPDYLDQYAPIGCYFGSHEGDSTLGFWQLIDLDYVLSEFKDVTRLSYDANGYVILAHDNKSIIDDLHDLDNFLREHAWSIYTYSNLNELTHITNTEYANLIKSFIVDKIMPLLAPKGFTWRVNHNGDYGLFHELPGYIVDRESQEYVETVELLKDANDIIRLIYIIDNKQTGKIMNKENLFPVTLDILDNPHFKPFYQSYNKAKSFSEQDMINFIIEDNRALNWVIETRFYDDFKHDIDRVLGSQDITRLFLDIVDSGHEINGISDDVYSLRESCDYCRDIEIEDYGTIPECGCGNFNEFNNVWIVNSKEFYEELENQGAMVYETDSLFLYLQTTYSGTHYDTLLRRTWLSYHASWCTGHLTNGQ